MAECPRCHARYGAEFLLCPGDGADLVGLLEGRYRVEALLGEGGMGRVYRAEHVGLQKPVALKVLRSELGADATVVARFQNEAIAASKMGDPRIVEVTDFGRTPEGGFYSVMELIRGQTLEVPLAKSGAFESQQAIELLEQISLALQVAHTHGIVHRDLKPQNVMLLESAAGQPQRVKLLDFGVSKVLGRRERPLTDAGSLLGTAAYMAPEQINAESVDSRADIYALGALAYELLTGTPPFRKRGTVAVLLQHLHDAVEPPSQRKAGAGIPPELEELVLRMLRKRPEERPGSMAEVLEALRRIRGAPTVIGLPQFPRTTPSRGRLITVAICGAIAMAVLATAWTSMSRGDHGPGAQTSDPNPPVSPSTPTGGAGAISERPSSRGLEPMSANGAPARAGAVAGASVNGRSASMASGPSADAALDTRREPTGQVVSTPAAVHRLQVFSTPAGALVREGSVRLGRTPIGVEVTSSPRLLTVELPGFQPAQVRLTAESADVELFLAKLPDPEQTRRSSAPAKRDRTPRDLKPSPF